MTARLTWIAFSGVLVACVGNGVPWVRSHY